MEFKSKQEEKKYYEETATEDEYLTWYHNQDLPSYKKPSVTVDMVTLRYDKEDNNLKVLSIQRKRNPWRNKWALVGGFVDEQEDIITAGKRELQEETTLVVDKDQIQPLPAWSQPNRDPRNWTITNPLIIQLSPDKDINITASDDAKNYQWLIVRDVKNLDFASDHKDILINSLANLETQINEKGLYPIRHLLSDSFDLSDANNIVHQLTGHSLKPEMMNQLKVNGDKYMINDETHKSSMWLSDELLSDGLSDLNMEQNQL